MTFAKTKERTAPAKSRKPREAGGDNEVERDGNGRPQLIVDCDGCDGSGRIPSEKKPPPATIKCKRSCGPTKDDPTIPVGKRKRGFTRVTTYIDVLDDKSNLMDWGKRMVLIGVAGDQGFLKDVLSMDPEDPEDKKVLSARAEAAAEFAGAGRKAEWGTELHGFSEDVDNGLPLPQGMEPTDWLTIQSYAAATQPLLHIVHMERLVVCDELGTAGTPDRVSSVRQGVTLSAPNGYVFDDPDELIITDLKTGRVDYGALKMAMQLAMYSRSKLYVKGLAERLDLGNVNQKWGIIMHSPAGKHETTLYWADLELGWEAIMCAKWVRELRSRGRKGLIKFAPEGTPFARAA